MSGPDDPTPITVTVTPRFADWVSFHFRCLFTRPQGVVLLLFVFGFTCAYGVYSVQFLRVPPGPIRSAALVALAAVPVFVLVLMLLGAYSEVRRRWRAAPVLREPRTYTFTDAEVRAVGETFAVLVAWPSVTTATRVGDQVLLETGQQFLIPLWAFDTENDRTGFLDLVAARVKGCRL
jgi:hypothetical protein